MNIEVGSTLVNGFALFKALSVIYKDLKDSVEINSVASKYVFVDISELNPEFNVIKKYPISSFKTFSNVVQVNIKNITIVPAVYYDLKCAGIVTLIDVSTMDLKGIGMIKSVSALDVEILWLNYISEAKQIVSNDVGNLISIGTDNKLFLSDEIVETTKNKIYVIDDDVQIVKVFETYLDYSPAEIKKLKNVHDGSHIVILKDQLHNNKSWLYVLSSTDAISPVITSVGEYTKIKEYPSAVAVKSYVDSCVMGVNQKLDNDTIVHDKSSDLWGVALDRHTIKKNKNGLYSVDLDVLREEMLQVPSTPGNIVFFNENEYIEDTGYGITKENDDINDESKKLVTKKFLHNQYITALETTDMIESAKIKINK